MPDSRTAGFFAVPLVLVPGYGYLGVLRQAPLFSLERCYALFCFFQHSNYDRFVLDDLRAVGLCFRMRRVE